MPTTKPNAAAGVVYAVLLVLAFFVALFLWDCFTGEFRLGD
jgi:hypothetical protein